MKAQPTRALLLAVTTAILVASSFGLVKGQCPLVVDPGHGGNDGGTKTHYVDEVFHEREINLLVAL